MNFSIWRTKRFAPPPSWIIPPFVTFPISHKIFRDKGWLRQQVMNAWIPPGPRKVVESFDGAPE